MAYNTPKTNWNASDIPNPDDFNRIEGNAEDNHDRLNDIEDGTTKVPIAENADNADNAEKIEGQKIGKERFQLSGNTGRTELISSGSFARFQEIVVSVPAYKKLILKQVRYKLASNLNLKILVAPSIGIPSSWEGNYSSDDEILNLQINNLEPEKQNIIIRIQITNNSESDINCNEYDGWWIDLSIE